jgi:hypothetical protein
MKIEDIEKLLKVGCKVQLDTRDFPIEITHLDAEYVWNHENGHATRHNWRSIKDIVSWPIPVNFEQKHVGHFVRVGNKDHFWNHEGDMDHLVGKWVEIRLCYDQDRFQAKAIGDDRTWLYKHNHVLEYSPIPVVEKTTPISDDEFNALQPGDRLKIATTEYIDRKCDHTGYYKWTLQGSNQVDNGLKRHYGNDSAEVKNLLCNEIVSIKEGYTIHRDFIVGVIKMKEKKPYPLVECKDFSILHCEVGDFIKLNSEHPSWMKVIDPPRRLVKFSGGGESHVYNDYIKYRIQSFFSFPEGWFYRVKEVWYQYPPDSGANWGDIEAISETLPLYGEIATGSPQPNVLQIKEEEKIMLNTVEEIKQLDAKNIEEAAKKVKQNRDNAEVKQASEKLTQLLDRKESLEASKKDIEKQLKEVNDLVEALGYPPKEG